mgnify:CR=1 FL=1
MPTYKAPVEDALFLLNDVFHLERYGNLAGFADDGASAGGEFANAEHLQHAIAFAGIATPAAHIK